MKFRIIALLLSLGLLIGLTACGNRAASDTLVMAVEKNPTSFDPLRGTGDAVSAHILQLIYDPLVVKDSNFQIVPRLADYEHSPDYKVFTFRIKPGIKFQNGKDLTAADVKYTYTTLVNSNLPVKADLAPLDRIETPDPMTVVFHFNQSLPQFLVNTAVPIGIMPDGAADTIAESPIGTGPYRRTAYVNTQYIDFEAFDGHFLGAPKVKKLRVRIVPDDSTRQLEFANGTIDLAVNTQFSPDTIEQMRQTSGLKVETTPGTRFSYLAVNNQDTILKNERVRQAIAYGINRDIILDQIWHGQARKAYGPLPPEHWANEADIPKYDHDPDRAMQLLTEAGYPAKGKEPRLRIKMATSSVAISRQIAAIFQEQLARVGIALELEQYETATFIDRMRRGQFQLGLANWVGANEDPDFFRFSYSSEMIPREATNYAGGNRSRYSNPQVDKLLAEVQQNFDQNRRKELYSTIQKTIATDLPLVPLWLNDNIAVQRTRVTNVKVDPSGSYYFIKDVTLAD